MEACAEDVVELRAAEGVVILDLVGGREEEVVGAELGGAEVARGVRVAGGVECWYGGVECWDGGVCGEGGSEGEYWEEEEGEKMIHCVLD